MKYLYFASVSENCLLKIADTKGFNNTLKEFIGKAIRITIEPKAKRSNKQNNYFHGVVVPIVKAHLIDLGWNEAKSSEWVKNYIKYNCLIKESVNELTGECIKTLGETSTLTTAEFMDFIADIQEWAATKLDLQIPNPGEVIEMEF